MTKQLVLALAFAICARGATQPPEIPQAGVIRSSDRRLRPLLGISGNLISAAPLASIDALAASFSSELGLILTPGALKLLGLDGNVHGSYKTESREAILGIAGSPETAVAWLPAEQKLIRWSAGDFKEIPLDEVALPGPIVDARITGGGTPEILVRDEPISATPDDVSPRRERQASVLERLSVSPEGRLTSVKMYPNITGSALMLDSSLLYEDAKGLTIENSNGSVKMLAPPEPGLSFEKASKDWVHLASPSTHREWVIHLDRSHPALSEIPAVQPLPIGEKTTR